MKTYVIEQVENGFSVSVRSCGGTESRFAFESFDSMAAWLRVADATSREIYNRTRNE